VLAGERFGFLADIATTELGLRHSVMKPTL
jgi:hypothetical protein